MNDINLRKKEANYLRLISQIILNDLNDEDISELISIVDVKLSRDNTYLKIFVSFARNEKKLLNKLEYAKGFIRKALSNYELGRKVPNLIFQLDQVEKNAERIEEILRKLKK